MVGIYGIIREFPSEKSPETVDATGFSPVASIPFCFYGDPAGIRTPDTLLKRQVLCLLSYWVIFAFKNKTKARFRFERRRKGVSAVFAGSLRLCAETETNGLCADVAGMAGLEPTISESKSGVLPLHYIPPST